MSHGQSRLIGLAPQVQWMSLDGRAATAQEAGRRPGGRGKEETLSPTKQEVGSPQKPVTSAQMCPWVHHLPTPGGQGEDKSGY